MSKELEQINADINDINQRLERYKVNWYDIKS